VDEAIVGMFAIFCIFIALPWMILHFLTRQKQNVAKAAGDPAMNAALTDIADRLERRLDAIEILLDHEVPGWNKAPDRRSS
jgi:phage shock protein B